MALCRIQHLYRTLESGACVSLAGAYDHLATLGDLTSWFTLASSVYTFCPSAIISSVSFHS